MKEVKSLQKNFHSIDLCDIQNLKMNEFTTSKKSQQNKIPKFLANSYLENSEELYKTPKISKNSQLSYSKMEMPETRQISHIKRRCLGNFTLRNPTSLSEIEAEVDINNNYEEEEINQSYRQRNEQNENSARRSKSSNNSNEISIGSFVNILEQEKLYKNTGGNISFIHYGRKNKKIFPFKFIKRHYKKLEEEQSEDEEFITPQNTLNREDKSFVKFNLTPNPLIFNGSRLCNSPIHHFLPYCKKNDESYKKNLMNYIRHTMKAKFTVPKSIAASPHNYTVNKKNEVPNEKENEFFLLKKKKKIYSLRKTFSVEKDMYPYRLVGGKNIIDYNNPKKFKFYFDNDIGFNLSWQKPLIVAHEDDDVETDDEILTLAIGKCNDDLFDGIERFNQNKRNCRNYCLVQKMKKREDLEQKAKDDLNPFDARTQINMLSESTTNDQTHPTNEMFSVSQNDMDLEN